jgi:hypothetical protein
MSLALLAALSPLVVQGGLIDFGRLEAIFTGFFQVAMIIGIVIFILGVFLIFFPGAKKFIGGLIG